MTKETLLNKMDKKRKDNFKKDMILLLESLYNETPTQENENYIYNLFRITQNFFNVYRKQLKAYVKTLPKSKGK